MNAIKRKALSLLLAVLLVFTSLSVGIQTVPVATAATATQGDVDGDGSITSTDARLVLQYYAGKIKEENLNLSVADVDGDSAITSTDARLILQYYAGKIPEFPGKAGHTVTFKDTDGTVIATQTVAENGTVTLPETPAKDNYTFKGWTTDPEGTTPFDPATPITGDITLYAQWTEGVYELYAYISNWNGQMLLEVYGTVPEPQKVMVRLIEEEIFFSPDYPQNKQYVEGISFVWEKEEMEFPYAEEGAPTYFAMSCEISPDILPGRVLEAAFVDEDGEMIGIPYLDTAYTERAKSFAAITVEDFADSDTVLNFDEDPAKNFGVLADDVVVIRAESVATQLDHATGAATYTVQSPNKALTVGEKVFVNASDCETGILCKIQSVTKAGDTYTVIPVMLGSGNAARAVGATDTSVAYTLDDFYKFLKVDMRESFGIVTEGETLDGAQYLTTVISLPAIEKTSQNVEVAMGVTGTVRLRIKAVYAPKIFGEDYLECSMDLTVDLEGSLSATLKASASDNERDPLLLKITTLPLPLGTTGFSVYGEVGFLVAWDLRGDVGLEWNASLSAGFTYSHQSKTVVPYRNVYARGEPVEYKGEAHIRLGPQATVGLQFLNGIAKAEITSFCGVEAEGEVAPGDGNVHMCKLCATGTISTVAEFAAKVEFNGGPFGTYTPVDTPLISLKEKIDDFYVSLDEEYGYAGWGKCRNNRLTRNFSIYIEADKNKWTVIRDVFVGNNGHGDTSSGLEYDHVFFHEGEHEFNGRYRIDLSFNTGYGQLRFELANPPEPDENGDYPTNNYPTIWFEPTFQIGIYKEQSTLVAWDSKLPEEYYVPGHEYYRREITWTEEDERINWSGVTTIEIDGVTLTLVPRD